MADLELLLAGRTLSSPQESSRIFRPSGLESWVVQYTWKGAATVGRGADQIRVEEGDLMLIPAKVAHDYGHASGERWTHLWAEFNPNSELLSKLNWPECSGGVRILRIGPNMSREQILNLFLQIESLVYGPLQNRKAIAACFLEGLFCLCEHFNPNGPLLRHDERILNVQAYICQHYPHELKLDHLADMAHLSISRFSELFQAESGMSVMKYLEKIRMRHALELLRMSSKNVGQIAQACGYNCPFHFSRVFKCHTGLSPKHYRQNMA